VRHEFPEILVLRLPPDRGGLALGHSLINWRWIVEGCMHSRFKYGIPGTKQRRHELFIPRQPREMTKIMNCTPYTLPNILAECVNKRNLGFNGQCPFHLDAYNQAKGHKLPTDS